MMRICFGYRVFTGYQISLFFPLHNLPLLRRYGLWQLRTLRLTTYSDFDNTTTQHGVHALVRHGIFLFKLPSVDVGSMTSLDSLHDLVFEVPSVFPSIFPALSSPVTRYCPEETILLSPTLP